MHLAIFGLVSSGSRDRFAIQRTLWRPSMNALELIAEKAHTLSQAKQELANYILANWEEAAFMPAGQLARAVGLSESVIVRFATDLGYSGYPQMRAALQELLRDRISLVEMFRKSSQDAGDTGGIAQVLEEDLSNLRTTIEQCQADDVVAAADLIIQSRRVVVLGARSSAGPGYILALYLNEVLGNTQFLPLGMGDLYDQLRSLDNRDLVIGISFAWYTKYIVDALEFVRAKGCRTLAITDTHASPLLKHADMHFHVRVGNSSFYVSHVATLGLVHVLLKLVSQKAGDRAVGSLTEMEQIYQKYYIPRKSGSRGQRMKSA